MRSRHMLILAAALLLPLAGTSEAMKRSPGVIIGAFSVSLDPGEAEIFREIDGMNAAIEVMEYQEGGVNDKTHRLVGPVRYSSIILRKGATLTELLEERLAVTSDPDEQQRLQDLIARADSAPYRIMYTNFDPRLAPDDDLFLNDVVRDVFMEDGCEAFIVSAQLPIADPPLVLLDPDDRKSSNTVKKFFNPAKDAANRLILMQRDGTPIIEWTTAEPMTVDVELLFGGVRDKEDVKRDAIKRTKKLSLLPFKVERPPLLHFEWGTSMRFRGVLDDLSVAYTKFLPDGTPTRATMSVTFRSSAPPGG